MRQWKVLSLYGFAVLFNAVVSFGTFSILTHYLTQADYGVINLYSSFLTLLLPFIAIGVQYSIGIDYFKETEDGFRHLFTNALVIPVVTTLFFTLIFFLFNSLVKNTLKVNFLFGVTIPIVCFLTLLIDVFFTLFRNKGKHLLYIGFSLLKNIAETGTTLLFVVVLGYHWQGRLGSSFLVLLMGSIFVLFLIRQWHYYTGTFDTKKIRQIFLTGLPFIPERLAIFVLAGSDRFFIEHFVGLAAVGLYGSGAQLAIIINLAISTLSNTFYPVLYRNLENREGGYAVVRKATAAYVGAAALIATGVILIIPVIFKYFIGPNFQHAKPYAVYLTIGMFFWAVYNAFLPFLLILKKNKLVMYISIAGMLISIVSNFYNVQHYGALGATYTSIIVYACMAVMVIFFAHKYYNLKTVFVSQ